MSGVAIVHDYLTQRGGAERVVLSLARLFPGAPIFTSLYDPDDTYPELSLLDVRPSPLQRVPHEGDSFRRLLPLYPAAFGRIDLSGFDTVISSSSGWAHGVQVDRGARHLWYCYTPARWLYRPDLYLQDRLGGGIAGSVLRPLLAGLRRWDQRAARRPGSIAGISEAIAHRIHRTYGRPATVIHPPVEVDRIAEAGPSADPDDPYYLVISRLLPYKRVDLPVQVCRERQARLVVVGDGPDRERITQMAGPLTELRSGVSDDELVELLGGCRALIHVGEEDFGLTPLEANAAGRPCVALGRSGALDTVVDGATGVLVDDHEVASLHDALDRIETTSWDRQALVAHARTFSEPRFHAQILALLRDTPPNA